MKLMKQKAYMHVSTKNNEYGLIIRIEWSLGFALVVMTSILK